VAPPLHQRDAAADTRTNNKLIASDVFCVRRHYAALPGGGIANDCRHAIGGSTIGRKRTDCNGHHTVQTVLSLRYSELSERSVVEMSRCVCKAVSELSVSLMTFAWIYLYGQPTVC